MLDTAITTYTAHFIFQDQEELKKQKKLQREMERLQIEKEKKEREMKSYKLLDTDPDLCTSNQFDNESDAERELVDDFM